MKRILAVALINVFLNQNSFAENKESPDAYDVLLKNQETLVQHDGCNYPKSGTGNIKLGHAFKNIFDRMMVDEENIIILKNCSSQDNNGWHCSISFNSYYNDTKEIGPSPYTLAFSVNKDLVITNDLPLLCY
jgi:hypothetical protein